uniref:Tyrosine-specific transport protein n=1 Tax=Aegilops tauschii TaxID=37682 RepID=M8BEJ7_AEGTA
MAAAALQCCPVLGSRPASSISRSFSARTPAVSRTGEARRRRLQQCRSQSAEGRSPGSSPPQLERLFSNVNKATMKHEPGSITGSVFLVAGTTNVIDRVNYQTRHIRGDMQSEKPLKVFVCHHFLQVVTGLLVAEVNVNTMCELGSGSVSLVSMAKRTLGTAGVRTVCQRVIGAVNGFLVFSIIASFTVLVVVASGNIQWSSLLETNFAAAPQSIPIIALSFVYQNVVPVLCTNLEGDLSKVRKAIVLGTAIPLALFLVWDAVILGTIPGFAESGTITDPLQQLRSSNGTVGPIVEAFSFLAIGTSYIGFVLGLTDFIADLLKLPSGQNKPLTYLVTLFPPLVLSLLDPEIFFKALDFAGTYGVLVLFGVFPAAMSWSERYSNDLEAPISPIVPGGKLTLSFVMGGALLVIFSEVFKDIMQLQGLN